MEISFKGSDPAFAAAVANAFAEEYQKLSIQLRVEPMKQASTYFNGQLKLLRDNVEVTQARLSKYQQEHGIVSVDNRLDVESNRLKRPVTAVGVGPRAIGRSEFACRHGDGRQPDRIA